MTCVVVVFPGSNCDRDVGRALAAHPDLEVVYLDCERVPDRDVDAVFLPGGFSYGDYLRAGAIARLAPVMRWVAGFAAAGGPVLGICNGFQILCEAGLLPGALHRNLDLRFHCHDVWIRVETNATAFTWGLPAGQVLRLPIAHGQGRFVADTQTLRELEARGQIVFRYCQPDGRLAEAANPNGSLAAVAGVCNEGGNVVGLMPHPERAADARLGGTDGQSILFAWLRWLAETREVAPGGR